MLFIISPKDITIIAQIKQKCKKKGQKNDIIIV